MADTLKVSLIITVKNEQATIGKLLESIIHQAKKPSEIIIADAGSTDQTQDIINHHIHHLPQIQLIKVGESTRGKGRNLAIAKAKNDLIAVTDAGCELKSDWLEKITHPLITQEADVVAGYYLTDCESPAQCASAPFVAVMPDRLDPDNFLPSSRSVAFTKAAWKKAGKYPEAVSYCEDLLFAQKLKASGTMVIQPKAIVFWHHFKSLTGFYRQLKNYAYGDVEARYRPHVIKILTVYARYLLFFIFPPLFLAYLYFPIAKHARYVKHPSAVFYLPVLQLTADAAVIAGSLKAVL